MAETTIDTVCIASQFGTKHDCQEVFDAIGDDFDRKVLVSSSILHTPLDIVQKFRARAVNESADYQRAIADMERAFIAQHASVSQVLCDMAGDGYAQGMATFLDGWSFGERLAAGEFDHVDD